MSRLATMKAFKLLPRWRYTPFTDSRWLVLIYESKKPPVGEYGRAPMRIHAASSQKVHIAWVSGIL